MTKAESEMLVTEGYAIDQTIKEQSKRLDEIKEILSGAANGQDCTFSGARCLVDIGFYPALARKLEADKEAKARELAGSFFNKLFQRAPVPKFKDVAKALLGDNAKKLVALLSGPKAPRLSFKAAD